MYAVACLELLIVFATTAFNFFPQDSYSFIFQRKDIRANSFKTFPIQQNLISVKVHNLFPQEIFENILRSNFKALLHLIS